MQNRTLMRTYGVLGGVLGRVIEGQSWVFQGVYNSFFEIEFHQN